MTEGVLDEIEIHSVSWDTTTRSITYSVGQNIKTGKNSPERQIIKILRDEVSFHKFGNICYRIYITLDGAPKLWRLIENKPVDIVFKI
jgi:hypothetical protein